MKSKRIITGLIAALMLVSVCACQKSDTAESGGEAVRLKNYMTETEKNIVSIGELTLLDGDVTEESPDGENTVEIDWWTDKDYRKKYEEDKSPVNIVNFACAQWPGFYRKRVSCRWARKESDTGEKRSPFHRRC